MTESLVHPEIWQTIAGATYKIPIVGSWIYYFPLRHPANDSSYPSMLPPHLLSSLSSGIPILCSITSVKLLADPNTDEVFAKVTLLPSSPLTSPGPTEIQIPPSHQDDPIEPITDQVFAKLTLLPSTTPENPISPSTSLLPSLPLTTPSGPTENPIPPSTSTSLLPSNPIPPSSTAGNDEDAPIKYFTKVLASYDVNKGDRSGGFCVPSFCADLIFPRLKFPTGRVTKETEKPWQVIEASDVHGKTWEFRHTFSNDKWCYHTLTTGWSRFVHTKKLVEGNTLVFMKKFMDGKMKVFIGIRRTGPSKESKGKSSPEEITNGLELAARRMPFEVLFYPRLWLPDFVVSNEDVLDANLIDWKPGMLVAMHVENTGRAMMNWVRGTVSELENQFFPLLKIEWEKDFKMEPSWVSPWRVFRIEPCCPVHGTEHTHLGP